MKNYRVVAIVLTALVLAFSASGFCDLQKPTVDNENGFSIALPTRWESQPIAPPDSTSRPSPALQSDTKELLIYKGPQGCEFRLFKISGKNIDEAFESVQSYATSKGMKDPTEKEDIKLKDKNAKMKKVVYLASSRWSGDWKCYYFAAHIPNGAFMLIYQHPAAYKQYEKQVLESATSFKPAKTTESDGEALDPRIDLPAGWKLHETANYFIQYNEKDDAKVTDFGKKIEKLHDAHISVLKPNPQIESLRPKKQREKFVIKYFKDAKGFQGYAGDQGVWGAAAYYSPSQGEIAFYLSGWSKKTLCILYHECTHQFLQEFVGGPRVRFHIWINEGLAEYFFAAGWEDADKIIPGTFYKEAANDVKAAIRTGKHLLVKDVIKMTQQEYYRYGRFAYNHGWTIVHFLLNSKNERYRQVIPTYFYAIQETCFPILEALSGEGLDLNKGDANVNGGGANNADLAAFNNRSEMIAKLSTAQNEALEKAFLQIDLDKLQAEWEEYYR